MKKLRNLDQLSPEKRAALEAILSSPEEVVTPMQAQPILEADPNTLEAVIEEGIFTQTLGELLEQARTSRGVGVRELARRLQVNHSQIKQLEGSGRGRLDNMEVQSLTRQAKALSYRVRIVLEPEEGGTPLEVRFG